MAPPLLRILIKSRGLAHPPGNLGSSVADGPSVISFEDQPLCWQMALHPSPSCAHTSSAGVMSNTTTVCLWKCLLGPGGMNLSG